MPVNNPGPPLVWTIPTGSPTAAKWLAAAASSGMGPWASVLYVDNVRGNDATAQRGNANLPFATIQAAINAMLTDDVVQLAPQTFTITAPITVPSSVVRGSVVGFGGNAPRLSPTLVGTTRIVNSGAMLAIWNFATVGLTDWRMSKLECVASSALGISADGSAYAQNTFFSGGLLLEQVVLYGGGLTAKYAMAISLDDCVSFPVTAISCSSVTIANFTLLVSFAISFDATDPLAPSAGNSCSVTNCGSPGGVTLGPGQPQLTCDATSALASDITGNNLSVSGAKLPKLVLLGTMRGNLFFNGAGQELPDTASALTFDFRGAKFVASTPALSLALRFKVAGAAANAQMVRMDSSTAQPGTTIVADQGIHLTARGMVAPQAVYQTPGATGDIIPPALNGTIDISAGGALAKTWADLGYTGLVRTGVAPATCLVTSGAALADAFVPSAGKLVTGFTITSIAAAGNVANWEARF